MNRISHVFIDFKALANLGAIEKSQYFRARKSTVRQAQQIDENPGQRMAVADTHIREIPAEIGSLLADVVLKNGFDVGGVAINFRHHDQDIFGVQIVVAIEQIEQVVVQDLALAQRTVAALHGDTVVQAPAKQ